ncbi:type III secretion protein S [Natronocella acetinitrilica]|jgi:type III secretion protein S|uniref:Type III secretion protein S n=1 Tax=Natronocella acetinitrilica TaxID=414046 RepID=A0AAE3G4P8_9GAMM|nr:type III secretion system export apparatus subunit SctS [Natronocella acetinitrilica]MCP1675317.1 type III secretion protein S [Natronocella acetinitrilica]
MLSVEIGYHLGRTALLVLMLSLPAVGVGALVGLLVGLFQGLTQIQDQTISFALRMLATTVTLIMVGPWMARELTNFAAEMFRLMEQV